MANDPVLIRANSGSYPLRPGAHTHNARRRRNEELPRPGVLHRLRFLFLMIGICALGYYGYTLADQYVYQTYENWAFDQQIAGNTAVTFTDYLRQATPFGILLGRQQTVASKPGIEKPSAPVESPRPAYGSLLGRLEIARLHLSAMVREGVDEKVLSMAVGHVPATALPGQAGNFAIAAHRDTLFRALKDIRKGDVVTFQSSAGTYNYQVLATKIVKPSDVSVLRADGGGVIPATDLSGSAPQPSLTPASAPVDAPPKLLTMITCYPFYYVGSAPKRFIVQAKLVPGDSQVHVAGAEVATPGPLLDRNTLGEVPGLVHIASAPHRDMIRKQL